MEKRQRLVNDPFPELRPPDNFFKYALEDAMEKIRKQDKTWHRQNTIIMSPGAYNQLRNIEVTQASTYTNTTYSFQWEE